MTSQVLNLAIDNAQVYGKFMGSLVILDFIEPYQYSQPMHTINEVQSTPLFYRGSRAGQRAHSDKLNKPQLTKQQSLFNLNQD